MRVSSFGATAFLVIAIAGCAAAPPPAPLPPAQPTPLTDTGAWASAPRETFAPPASRTLAQRGTILIGEPAPPPAPERPQRRGRIEVSFQHADLENAMRFLADSGRFNLVVESGLTGSVTASLRGVDPYDALLSIAQANGVAVRYENGIVTVKRTSAKQ